MFEKGKAWHAKEQLQLIHSDNVVLLKLLLCVMLSIFLLLLMIIVEKIGFIFRNLKMKFLVNFKNLNPWLKMNLVKVLIH